MEAKLDYMTTAPDAFAAVLALSEHVNGCGLEPALLELVKIRASQINGCAFCLDMHVRDARAGGESEERIHMLPAWRETALYTPREQAALAWTEALTLLAGRKALNAAFEQARAHFSEDEMANLVIAIGVINVWNRLNIAFEVKPPAHRRAAV